MPPDSSLARLTIAGDTITFQSDHYGAWQLALADIALVGEYTTEEGPFAEDHLLVLVDHHGNDHEIPISSEGRELLIHHLERKFQSPIELTLVASTRFASAILLPAALRGQPLYTFENAKIPFPKNLISFPQVARQLSPNVLAHLS